MPTPNRREALAAVAAATIGSNAYSTTRAGERDLIKTENARAGTTDWQLTYIKFDSKAKYRQSLIEGYCTRTSVAATGRTGGVMYIDTSGIAGTSVSFNNRSAALTAGMRTTLSSQPQTSRSLRRERCCWPTVRAPG